MRSTNRAIKRWCAALALGCCLVVGAHASLMAGDSSTTRTPLPACDDESIDPWVLELREQVLTSDDLARYAIEQFGEPVACHGRVHNIFDGMKFGTLRLRFDDDATLLVETMPPETSRVSLVAPNGFADHDEARRRLADYVADIGVEIDWTRPEKAAESSDTAMRFWADDPGLNASAELVFNDGKLTTLRFSMAL